MESRAETVERLLGEMCDQYCHWPFVLSQEALDEKCKCCPLDELAAMAPKSE